MNESGGQRSALGVKLLHAIRPQGLENTPVVPAKNSEEINISKLQESIDTLKALTIDTPINSSSQLYLNRDQPILSSDNVHGGLRNSLPLSLNQSRRIMTADAGISLSNPNLSKSASFDPLMGSSQIFHPHRFPPGLSNVSNVPPGFRGPPPGLGPSTSPRAEHFAFSLKESLVQQLPPPFISQSQHQSSLFHPSALNIQQAPFLPLHNENFHGEHAFNHQRHGYQSTIAMHPTSMDQNLVSSHSQQLQQQCQSYQQISTKIYLSSEKAKSSALLSMLKSKAGEVMSKSVADSTSYISPPVEVIENSEKADTTEQQIPPTVKKMTNHVRNTKKQVGQLIIKLKNSKMNSELEMQDGFYMRPGNVMNLVWKIPFDFPIESSTDLAVGLLRYGSQVNMPSIVTKSLNLKQGSVVNKFRTGSIQFFAPKSAGQFVFRLFNQSSRETSLDTIATSSSFYVVLIDADIISNLQHVMDAFLDKLPIKAINQLTLIVKGIKSCTNSTKDCSIILNRCIDKVVDQINESLAVLDEGALKQHLLKVSMGENIQSEEISKCAEEDGKLPEDGKLSEDDDFWRSFKQAVRIHAEAHDALLAISERKTPWYLVSEKLKNTVKFMESLYCPILKRYFRNAQEMVKQRVNILEFYPSPQSISSTADRMMMFNNQIRCVLPQLFPSNEFYTIREKVRARLEFELTSLNSIPPGTTLAMYGSSANNFGNDGADLDMCLIFPSEIIITTEEKCNLIEKIGDVLSKIGMTGVKTRSTARIPIVQFQDNLSGLECDISLHNPLALANTKLLYTYSLIDPRVREMAYIIKHWVKRRHINSPQDGTLSSYGYILTILYFLQRRPVPIIPNLQNLPTTWPIESSADSGGCLTMIVNSADGIPCSTYFLHPTEHQLIELQRIASQNHETTGELIFEYFRYFAWEFDYRNTVVSIHSRNSAVTKQDKYEHDGWFHSDNLSIEDPFEGWYDVAHVIKSSQMTFLRKEFLRAYTLLCRFSYPCATTDCLPPVDDPKILLEFLWAECEPPSFSPHHQIKKSKDETN